MMAEVITTVGKRWKHILSGEFDIDDFDPNHSFSSYSTGLTLGACFHGSWKRC